MANYFGILCFLSIGLERYQQNVLEAPEQSRLVVSPDMSHDGMLSRAGHTKRISRGKVSRVLGSSDQGSRRAREVKNRTEKFDLRDSLARSRVLPLDICVMEKASSCKLFLFISFRAFSISIYCFVVSDFGSLI